MRGIASIIYTIFAIVFFLITLFTLGLTIRFASTTDEIRVNLHSNAYKILSSLSIAEGYIRTSMRFSIYHAIGRSEWEGFLKNEDINKKLAEFFREYMNFYTGSYVYAMPYFNIYMDNVKMISGVNITGDGIYVYARNVNVWISKSSERFGEYIDIMKEINITEFLNINYGRIIDVAKRELERCEKNEKSIERIENDLWIKSFIVESGIDKNKCIVWVEDRSVVIPKLKDNGKIILGNPGIKMVSSEELKGSYIDIAYTSCSPNIEIAWFLFYEDNGEEKVCKRLTSGFGKRKHPIEKITKCHSGIDINCLNKNLIVRSPVDGKIVDVERGCDVFSPKKLICDMCEDIECERKCKCGGNLGNYVKIYSNGYYFKFGHLTDIPEIIRVGKHVNKGDIIGYIREELTSGRSKAKHLHFQIDVERYVSSPANPCNLVVVNGNEKIPLKNFVKNKDGEKCEKIGYSYIKQDGGCLSNTCSVFGCVCRLPSNIEKNVKMYVNKVKKYGSIIKEKIKNTFSENEIKNIFGNLNNGILWIMAIILHESGGNPNSFNENSLDTGLMQISLKKGNIQLVRDTCNFNEEMDIEDIKNELFKPEKNIECGIRILKKKALSLSEWKISEEEVKRNCNIPACIKKYTEYYGIKAILRLYNGLSCNMEKRYHCYVDYVSKYYDILKQHEDDIISSTKQSI